MNDALSKMPSPEKEVYASIAVFAHNEERGIIACLESLYRGGLDRRFEAHVLANGCTDRTVAIVRAYAESHPEIHVHEMALGDKTNAWNCYIHDFSRPSPLHVFVDGDVWVAPGAFQALAKSLELDTSANAAAAVPGSGRNAANERRLISRDRVLAGNLYALSGAFVDRLKDAGIRLPIGLIGDDSWIAALAKFDLDVQRGWVDQRIAACPEARFEFHSLQPYRIRDIRLYWRRRIRYALRSWQNLCMKRQFHDQGIAGLPPRIEDLYQKYPGELKMHWRGLDTFFMWLALKRIKRTLSQAPQLH